MDAQKNMSKKVLASIVLTLVFILTSACQPGMQGGPGFNQANSPEHLDGIQINDGSASPMAEIPLPSNAPSIDTQLSINSAQDGMGNIPSNSQAGTVSDFATGDQVALSTQPYTPESASLSRTERSYLATKFPSFFAPAHADTDICANEDVACCPINADGSWDNCYLNTGTETPANLYLTVVNHEGVVQSASVSDVVLSNLNWLATEPTDIVTTSSGGVYAKTEETVIASTTDSTGATAVQGDYSDTSPYVNMYSQGTEIALSSSSYVGTLSQDGVYLYDVRGTEVNTLDTSSITGHTVISFSKINKLDTFGESFFGIEEEAMNSAKLFAWNTSSTSRGASSSSNNITIIDGDTDDSGTTMEHIKTLAFDSTEISGTPYTAVAYIDGVNNTNIRIIKGRGNYASERFGLPDDLEITPSTNIKDILLYNESSSNAVKIALLDADNQKVHIGEADVSAQTLSFPESKSIDVGSNPVGMSIDSTTGNLFVANAGDQTISVISLFNSDGTARTTPAVFETINLPDLFSGKSISFNLNTITLDSSKIYLGDTTHKSMININKDALGLTQPSDESSTSRVTPGTFTPSTGTRLTPFTTSPGTTSGSTTSGSTTGITTSGSTIGSGSGSGTFTPSFGPRSSSGSSTSKSSTGTSSTSSSSTSTTGSGMSGR